MLNVLPSAAKPEIEKEAAPSSMPLTLVVSTNVPLTVLVTV